MRKTGLLHAHSRFSSDGVQELAVLAARARSLGFDFIGMTEHAEDVDSQEAQRFVRECARLSGSQFLTIPGFEFSCTGNLHMLGLGMNYPPAARDPLTVAQCIREQGGLAIVAHPSRSGYRLPEGLERLIHGIEIWNARYDGWFVPNDQAIALLVKLQKTHGVLTGIGGQDLHELTDHGHVRMDVEAEVLNSPAILQALERGRFSISNAFIRIDPRALDGGLRRTALACARRAFLCARWITRPARNRLRRRNVPSVAARPRVRSSRQ